jgi:hypothetical protein
MTPAKMIFATLNDQADGFLKLARLLLKHVVRLSCDDAALLQMKA